MSENGFALDVYATLNAAGSFYRTGMKGAARETAASFVAAGLSTSLLNAAKNLTNNLSNTKAKARCVDYSIKIDANAISTVNNLPAISFDALEQVAISYIDFIDMANVAQRLYAGIDFYQTFTANTSSAFPTYADIVFINTALVGATLNNIQAGVITITGNYTEYSAAKNSVMRSYIGADVAELGDNMLFESQYLGGSKQSCEDFYKYAQSLCGSTYLSGTYTIKNLQTAQNSIAIITAVKYDKGTPIDVVIARTWYSGRNDDSVAIGQQVSNDFLPACLKIYYPIDGSYSSNRPSKLRQPNEKFASDIGAPILSLVFNENFLSPLRINSLKNTFAWTAPLGYTIKYYILENGKYTLMG